MDKLIFELNNVSFSYLGRFPALSNVDLSIGEGQRLALVGANGSGKSTLLNLLDGLIFPDKGNIKFCGKELKDGVFGDEEFSMDFRKMVAMVFQNPDVQLFCPTVKEDILFGPLQLGLDKERTVVNFERVTTMLGIGHLLDRAPHQLSIGEKRKAAIASSLVIDPKVLILDEPTAGLDPRTTRHLIDALAAFSETGGTLIMATQDIHIIPEMADRVVVMGEGKNIIKAASVESVLTDRAFLEEQNLVHVHAHKHGGNPHVHPHEHPSHDHKHPI